MLAGGGLPQRFADEMGRLVGPNFPKHLALAVSGGGDSMAMLHLAAPWAHVMGLKLWVVTIDHGLRDESAAEAALVARTAEALGLAHSTLRWHWDGSGNLQDRARQARLELIDRWRRGIEHVAFAHTQDDVAETFLMRLARGSGVEGLAAMADRREVSPHRATKSFMDPADVTEREAPPGPTRVVAGVLAYSHSYTALRPLLTTSRAELRHYLNVLKIDYVDDPSNDDPRYDRVKARQALPALEALGISRAQIATTAARLGDARAALAERALSVYDACIVEDAGRGLFDVTFARDAFAKIERETQLRLLATALQFVSLAPYKPRRATLEDTLDRALGGGATTLHGGYVYPHRASLYIVPEYARVKDLRAADGTWRGLYYCANKDIRPLGEVGAAQLRDQTDLPARVLWPAPAVWDGDRVLATPRLGENAYWTPTGGGEMRRLLTSR
ncbi:MAG: tRNA lysidine(34) synthetase TilS [Pseudomonadota bacterium]